MPCPGRRRYYGLMPTASIPREKREGEGGGEDPNILIRSLDPGEEKGEEEGKGVLPSLPLFTKRGRLTLPMRKKRKEGSLLHLPDSVAVADLAGEKGEGGNRSACRYGVSPLHPVVLLRASRKRERGDSEARHLHGRPVAGGEKKGKGEGKEGRDPSLSFFSLSLSCLYPAWLVVGRKGEKKKEKVTLATNGASPLSPRQEGGGERRKSLRYRRAGRSTRRVRRVPRAAREREKRREGEGESVRQADSRKGEEKKLFDYCSWRRGGLEKTSMPFTSAGGEGDYSLLRLNLFSSPSLVAYGVRGGREEEKGRGADRGSHRHVFPPRAP